MPQSLRTQIQQRALNCCEYCHMLQEFDPIPFQTDHVIAQKHRGTTVLDNLAWACYSCNNNKQSDISGIDPLGSSTEPVRLYNPRADNWHDHFEWNDAVLNAKTAVGGVTIYVLAINNPHRVRLRQLLLEDGFFPAQ